jgi:hypothetical protein
MAVAAVVVPVLVWLAAPAYVAQRIGSRGGRRYPWLWGLLLSWIGVVVVAVLTRDQRDQVRRQEAAAEEAEAGEDIETQKLRKFGLID